MSIESDLTGARKQLADLQLEAERARSRLEYQLKQVQQIEQRLAATEHDSALLERQQTEGASELEQQTAELSSLAEERNSAREALDEKSAERQEAQSQLTERERGLESLRQQVLRILERSLEPEKSSFPDRSAGLAGSERERTRAQSEEQQSTSDLERIERVKREISERLSARQTELTSVTDERQEIEQSLQSKKAALQGSRQTLERLRSEFSRVKARKDSLEEIISHRSYTTETVKRLFTAIAEGAGRMHCSRSAFLPISLKWTALREGRGRISARRTGVRRRPRLGGCGIGHRIFCGASIDGRATFLVEKSVSRRTQRTKKRPFSRRTKGW